MKKQAIYVAYYGIVTSIDYVKGTAQFSRFGTRTPETVSLRDLHFIGK